MRAYVRDIEMFYNVVKDLDDIAPLTTALEILLKIRDADKPLAEIFS